MVLGLVQETTRCSCRSTGEHARHHGHQREEGQSNAPACRWEAARCTGPGWPQALPTDPAPAVHMSMLCKGRCGSTCQHHGPAATCGQPGIGQGCCRLLTSGRPQQTACRGLARPQWSTPMQAGRCCRRSVQGRLSCMGWRSQRKHTIRLKGPQDSRAHLAGDDACSRGDHVDQGGVPGEVLPDGLHARAHAPDQITDAVSTCGRVHARQRRRKYSARAMCARFCVCQLGDTTCSRPTGPHKRQVPCRRMLWRQAAAAQAVEGRESHVQGQPAQHTEVCQPQEGSGGCKHRGASGLDSRKLQATGLLFVQGAA